MQIFLVGGAVRDQLLGLPSADKDWVVVGSDISEMLALGYIPVDKNFPVFINPDTHEEYALARTEKKTGIGYHGFKFYADKSVTLEQDLARRDLTINAIAMDENNVLIDPYHGQEDLKLGILRHVSDAFVEDPLRILRVARFISQFGFILAVETGEMIRRMLLTEELLSISKERVWKEFAKGLQGEYLLLMLNFLQDYGVNDQLFPELEELLQKSTDTFKLIIDSPGFNSLTLSLRLMLLCSFFDSTQKMENFLSRLALPRQIRDQVEHYYRFEKLFSTMDFTQPKSWLELFLIADALRKSERFYTFVEILLLKQKYNLIPMFSTTKIFEMLSAIKEIDVQSLLKNNQGEDKIKTIECARLDKLAQLL